jgi:hypothetical protein
MKDAYEVLHEKETELARIRHEIASLKIVAPMLNEETHPGNSENVHSSTEQSASAESEAEATGTDGLFSYAAVSRPKIWNLVKRGKHSENASD